MLCVAIGTRLRWCCLGRAVTDTKLLRTGKLIDFRRCICDSRLEVSLSPRCRGSPELHRPIRTIRDLYGSMSVLSLLHESGVSVPSRSQRMETQGIAFERMLARSLLILLTGGQIAGKYNLPKSPIGHAPWCPMVAGEERPSVADAMALY